MTKQRWTFWLTVPVLMLGVAFLAYRLAASSRLEKDSIYQGTELNGIAPDFRLRDQDGTLVSLSDFRGKMAVLAFRDSRRKDVCTLTAAQLIETYKQLHREEANQVVFAGVNVNTQANAVADVAKATEEWHLTEIPNWHFLTGEPGELGAVWKAYSIAVLPESDQIMHTSGVYIIDSSGRERWYVSDPSAAGVNPPP